MRTSHASTTRLLTIIILAAASTPAAAAPSGAAIAVEAFEGERPADADTILAPVYAELGKRGYTLGASLVTAVDARLSRDGGTLTASQVVDAQRDVDESYRHFELSSRNTYDESKREPDAGYDAARNHGFELALDAFNFANPWPTGTTLFRTSNSP